MADLRSAWKDAGERLSGLGLKLKLHYQQQRGEDGEQARSEVESAVKRLTDAVRDAFEAMGAAAKDQGVKEDVKQVGQSLTDALNATFAEVSDEVRKAFGRRTATSSVDEMPVDADTQSAGTPPALPPVSGGEQPPGEDSQR